MKKLAILMIFTTVSLIALSGCDKDTEGPLEGPNYTTLNTNMRELWSDHALWTRNVIINIVDGAPGTTEAVNRLLQNQEDIGDAIKPYYGNEAGDALTVLLKEHITTAAEILTTAKAGNTGAYNTALAHWYVNADEIATFLHSANPDHWPLAHMKMMMKDHLDLTLEEAVARLTGDYAADIIAYDNVYAELMIMADMLSEGIALQFSGKF